MRIPMTGILVLAMVMRFPGLFWGLPGNTHAWPYHPDESLALISLSQMKPSQFDFNPRQNQYGFFYIAVVGAGVVAGQAVGLWNPNMENLRQHPEQLGRIHFAGRLLSWISGLISLWALWFGTRNLWGDRVAFIALSLAAFEPAHYQLSQLFTPHLFGLMLMSGAFAAATSYGKDPPHRRALMPLILSSVLAALATSSYLLCSVSVLFPFLAVVLAGERVMHRLMLTIGIIALTFILSSPYIFFDLGAFIRSWISVQEKWFPKVSWISQIKIINTVYCLGFLIPIWALMGLSKIRSDRKLFFPVAIFAASYALAMRLDSGFARHFLPGLFFLVIPAGIALNRLSGRAFYLALLLTVIVNLPAIAWDLSRRLNNDSRDRASSYIESEYPNASIGIYSWFFAPHVSMKSHEIVRLTQMSKGEKSPELIIGRSDEIVAAQQMLATEYEIVWRSEKPEPWFMPKPVPEDWTYVSPEIIIARQKPF